MNKDSSVMLHTGNRMPIFGLGTWQLTHDTANTIDHALDLGYKMIDTSSDYGTQPGIGEGIKKSNISRKNFYLVTKVEETDDAYERVQFNLKELDLDFADLMLIHRPPQNGAGVELWEGLIKAQKDGLTRDIGVSNYSIIQMEELIEATGVVPVVNQIEWSPFGYSSQMKKFCEDREIIIQAYSPLTRAERLDDERLMQIAKKYGKSPAQILIRWSMQFGCVPLPKANQKKHQEENIDVFDFEIEVNDMHTLSGLNEEYSSLGSLPYV
jgi:diketogulonate reductase-like aldo/keto reductase